jgi:hypothetical protein
MHGCRSVIFIPAATSEHRAAAIAAHGAEVVRTGGDYDHAVRVAQAEADRNGWIVVSDTSYQGYQDIPRAIMQGYTVLVAEALDQLPGGDPGRAGERRLLPQKRPLRPADHSARPIRHDDGLPGVRRTVGLGVADSGTGCRLLPHHYR